MFNVVLKNILLYATVARMMVGRNYIRANQNLMKVGGKPSSMTYLFCDDIIIVISGKQKEISRLFTDCEEQLQFLQESLEASDNEEDRKSPEK